MWVYILKVDQQSCLFGKVDLDDKFNTIGYYLNNGKLMIRTLRQYDNRRRNLEDHRQMDT